MLREVEPVYVIACFGKQMGMPTLAARHVENARAGRHSEDVDHSRDFLSISLELEDRLVLEKVVGIEVRLPPFAFFLQKNTGSR
jgi:hypothetical protein